MVELHHIHAVLFSIAATIPFAVASVAWQHRAARGARPLAILMLGVAIWTAASAAMWLAPTLSQQYFWLKVMSLGDWMLPVGFLVLAFDIAGMDRWRTPGRIALLAAGPLLLANSVWLNPGGTFFREFFPTKMGPYTHWAFVPGPLYWGLVVVSYSMIVAGFIIIVRVHLHSSGAERTRTGVLLIGAIVPFAASALYQYRWDLLGDMDLGPIAFVATGILWFIALVRGQLLDILPLARDALVEQMTDGVVVIDEQDHIVDTNPAALRLLHAAPAEALGQPAETVLGGVAGAVPSLHGDIRDDAREKKHTAVPIRSGGDSRYVELGVTALTTGLDRSPARLLILHDVTDERRSKQLLKTTNRELKRSLAQIELLRDELREQAIRDPLTGVYNRRFLEESLPREMARAQREGAPVAFLLVDVDKFKLINDAHSHSMGDAALKMVAEVLLSGARMADIVCRYGGDEFLVVMLDVDREIAGVRAEEIRTQIEEAPVAFRRSRSAVTVSIGVSSFPANGPTAQDGIAAADAALHRAKESGRNRVALARRRRRKS